MGFQRLYLKTTTSTNTELSELLKKRMPRGKVSLRSDYQSLGRGQSGRGWYADEGKNLIISFLLHPAFLSASSQFLLSKMAALALCDLLQDAGMQAQVKWPNDLLVGQKKIGGILIEHFLHGGDLQHSIIGIGLNVNQKNFPDFPRPATSMFLESGRDHDPAILALRLEEKLMDRYRKLEEGERNALDEEYLGSLYGLNRPMRYRSGDADFKGTIRGVDEYGRLLLENGGKQRGYDMQEIVFLD